jgi:hypothetical protein
MAPGIRVAAGGSPRRLGNQLLVCLDRPFAGSGQLPGRPVLLRLVPRIRPESMACLPSKPEPEHNRVKLKVVLDAGDADWTQDRVGNEISAFDLSKIEIFIGEVNRDVVIDRDADTRTHTPGEGRIRIV